MSTPGLLLSDKKRPGPALALWRRDRINGEKSGEETELAETGCRGGAKESLLKKNKQTNNKNNQEKSGRFPVLSRGENLFHISFCPPRVIFFISKAPEKRATNTSQSTFPLSEVNIEI